MKTLMSVHIMSGKEYKELITDLGPKAHFLQIEVRENKYIEGVKDPGEPHDVYVMTESVEWLLSNE